MTPSGVSRLLQRLQEAAGITDIKISAHIPRHTFVKAWLESGGEVMNLSRLLGHSSMKVTEIYLEGFQSRQARS